MARKYQPRTLAAGTLNPKYYERPARRRYRKKHLPDGTPNPAYTPRRSRRAPDAARVAKWDRAEFIAWDGEGAEVSGRHVYILLRSNRGDGTASAAGLRSAVVLDALAAGLERHRHAVHVGFAFSYDVNMMLADLPRRDIARLWSGAWVKWRDFTLQYRPRKSFMLRQRIWTGAKWRTRGGVIWDVFGFFQSSFVAALENYGIGTAAERDAIAAMKAERSTFRPDQLDRITSYCAQECRLLALLVKRLRGYLGDAGLRIDRWDGAGACAAALLKREGIKAYKGTPPGPVLDAARHAYAGGRIEAVQYGHRAGPVYHYDLRSAYPAAMLALPCLAHGAWIHNPPTPPARERFALCRVRYEFAPGTLYPFFWRAPDGAIYFPAEGEGWYWAPEIRAAWDAGRRGQLRGRLDVLECWAWRPSCDHTPFGWLPGLYDQRQRWKDDGVGAEKALKLAINSLYGKTAQQVGGKIGQAPAYHQLEWAGWITSTTRARLFLAALPAVERDALVMLATDAIYSTVPLRLTGAGLGGWESHQHSGITVVQSGVYWTDQGDDAPAYYRGFDPGSLVRSAVLQGWRRGARSVAGTSSRFVGMGQALAGARAWDKWRRWVTVGRALALHPEDGKRSSMNGRRPRPDRGLVPTAPVTPSWHWMDGDPGAQLSAPIQLPWLLVGAGTPPAQLVGELRAVEESEDGTL